MMISANIDLVVSDCLICSVSDLLCVDQRLICCVLMSARLNAVHLTSMQST